MADTPKARPGKMRLIDATQYRLPIAAYVSILHRLSGLLMFALLPFILWMFDNSLSSEISYGRFTSAFTVGAFGLPAMLLKLVVLALIWAYLHHLLAGVRHLLLDLHVGIDLGAARRSSAIVLVLAIVLTLFIAIRLW